MTRTATPRLHNRVRVAPTALILACCLAVGTLTVLLPARAGAVTGDVYALANTCVQIADRGGKNVGGQSGPFTAKAAGLGSYLFSGRGERLLTATAGTPTLTHPVSPRAQWNVTGSGRDFTLTPAVAGSGRPREVRLTPATGCRPFPEPEIDVAGPVMRGTDAQGNLRGFVDSHAHLLSEQFLGGELHCGKPFDPLGVTVALRDCPDHEPEGIPAVSEQVLSRPGPHATDGWPTFSQWPRWDSLTHEQTYYRWIERSWRSGLRMIQNYYVQNRVLCEKYWRGDQPCNEMESVRIQHRLLHQLVDYVDAQNGGPGKGFLRIVASAADARRVIADGKVAVTLGIEISEPFGCREVSGRSLCSRTDIDAGLDELKSMGIRQVILTHKFDNALGGTRFDQGVTGTAVNTGEQLSNGHPWQVEKCQTAEKDNPVLGYPRGQQCNVRGLTSLGAYAVNGLIDRNMAIDIDHFSAKSAEAVLDIISRRHYPGVISSHTWTDPRNYGRILSAGGIVGLFATPAEGKPGEKGRHGDLPPDYLSAWRVLREQRSPDYFFGVGFGPDMGGLGAQAHPRPSASRNPVRYPFRGADGVTEISRQVSGKRVFDVNVDGTAHYGLLPDWIESLRVQAGPVDGPRVVDDLFAAAEAYTRMWERVEVYRG